MINRKFHFNIRLKIVIVAIIILIATFLPLTKSLYSFSNVSLEKPSQISPKILETPYVPPFILNIFKTKVNESLEDKKIEDLPEIIKSIYNGIIEWYNNIPQEQKDEFYKKLQLILEAILKAFFDLLEQIIRIIFS